VVVMPNSGVPSFSDLPGNCVGPSLSVSTELGVTPLACLGFLKGLVTVFTVHVEHALALDFHATLSIFHGLDTHKRKGERDNKAGERETRTDKHKEERRKDVVVEDTFFIFLTMQIRFPWTHLFQISQNYETIIKIHNFAQKMLQQKIFVKYKFQSWSSLSCITL
jgi:hypothetical protein